MRPFSSLFAKILLWFFLNLALVSVGLLLFSSLHSRMDLYSILGRQASDRMRIAGRLIAHDLNLASRAEWSEVLSRYGAIHQVDFVLVLEFGEQGRYGTTDIPKAVMNMVMDAFRPKPAPGELKPPLPRDKREPKSALSSPDPRSLSDQEFGRSAPFHGGPERTGEPRLMMRTENPTRYWVGIPIPLFPQSPGPPIPAMLLAVSDSITGKGFFFDPTPWIMVAAVVIFISVLFWIPLVSNITRSLARMTRAAEEIARGRFDVRIDEPRADEIGRLGSAINHMTTRMHGFVKGQKRFLGDVAHELGSPIARIQLGLGILERNVDSGNRERVADVIEDVSHMSNLVNELLSFSRAETNPSKVRLETTKLLPLVKRAVQRESAPETNVTTQVDPEIRVVTDPELLTRALANLIRNAVKYAGDAGPICVSAERRRDGVMMEVRDAGPGVPEDLMDRLFEPFFRPEPSRGRDSGGVGLGLAIVKTCIEACKGSVSARNLKPRGFVVTINLPGG
jgi:two-component system sensor histidine kinase CpxA